MRRSELRSPKMKGSGNELWDRKMNGSGSELWRLRLVESRERERMKL
jgi:hypothetical protein